ncbi:MAG: ATP-binding cassette domain-containing protein, partial [Planctomycetota bacterium]
MNEDEYVPGGEEETPTPDEGEQTPDEDEPIPPFEEGPVNEEPAPVAAVEEPAPGPPPEPAEPREILVSLSNLRTWFFTDEGTVKAVDGVSYDIYKGKTLGVVGESGCGKSVTALSILRLIPDPPGKIVEGEILFEGRDLVHASEAQMRKVRGNDISMIFQEPMTSLNPVFTVGDQI